VGQFIGLLDVVELKSRYDGICGSGYEDSRREERDRLTHSYKKGLEPSWPSDHAQPWLAGAVGGVVLSLGFLSALTGIVGLSSLSRKFTRYISIAALFTFVALTQFAVRSLVASLG
jgi:hypothetical protein